MSGKHQAVGIPADSTSVSWTTQKKAVDFGPADETGQGSTTAAARGGQGKERDTGRITVVIRKRDVTERLRSV